MPDHDQFHITLEQYRDLAANARAALRMIRDVVEQHAPPGSVPSEEMVEPPFVKEAKVLVTAILAIAAQRSGETSSAPAPFVQRRKADIERRKKLVPKREPKRA